MFEQNVRGLRYKLLCARVPEKELFLLVRGLTAARFPAARLGNFDRERRNRAGPKGQRVKGACKSSPLSRFLEKGNLLRGLIFAALLFQDDWIVTYFDLGRTQGIIFDSGSARVTSSLFGVSVNFFIAELEDEGPGPTGSCALCKTAGVTVFVLPHSDMTAGF